MLPSLIKNWNVIIDGRGYAGLAEDVTLPPLERAMVEYRGGGMLGPVKLDLGLNALSMSFTLAEFNADILRQWGLSGASAVPTRFLAAALRDTDEAPLDAIEIAVRGRWEKLDLGTVKGGEHAKMKTDLPLSWLRYSVNGTTLIEVDLIAGTEVVDGVDRQAAVREAIGLVS